MGRRPEASSAFVAALGRSVRAGLRVRRVAPHPPEQGAPSFETVAPASALVAVICALLLATALLSSRDAAAHELRPGAAAIHEVEPGVFAVRLTPARGDGGVPAGFAVAVPDGCTVTVPATPLDPTSVWACSDGLGAALTVLGRGGARVKIVVTIRHLDGERQLYVVAEDADRVTLRGVGPDATPLPGDGSSADSVDGSGAGPFVLWGFEHAITGVDHVLFVIALVLIAGTARRTLLAVTGFTAAHSLTLAAAALGWVRPPGAATEFVIAGSVLLVAAEAASRRRTLTTRYVGVVAAIFGLVHGFGFAGAFAELVGTGPGLVGRLLAFNVGVELAQMVVAGAGLAALALLSRSTNRTVWSRAIAYGAGCAAGVWTVQRGAAWVISLGL